MKPGPPGRTSKRDSGQEGARDHICITEIGLDLPQTKKLAISLKKPVGKAKRKCMLDLIVLTKGGGLDGEELVHF
jgi:hypothetical protein